MYPQIPLPLPQTRAVIALRIAMTLAVTALSLPFIPAASAETKG